MRRKMTPRRHVRALYDSLAEPRHITAATVLMYGWSPTHSPCPSPLSRWSIQQL